MLSRFVKRDDVFGSSVSTWSEIDQLMPSKCRTGNKEDRDHENERRASDYSLIMIDASIIFCLCCLRFSTSLTFPTPKSSFRINRRPWTNHFQPNNAKYRCDGGAFARVPLVNKLPIDEWSESNLRLRSYQDDRSHTQVERFDKDDEKEESLILRDSERSELPDEVWDELEQGQPSELQVMKGVSRI